MIILFPKLDKLTNKNKKLQSDHISKYVHIKNGFAFVVNEVIAVVDLKKYVSNYIGFSDEEESIEFDTLLEFIEGKSFTSEYWSYLTKKVDVKAVDDELLIENIGFKIALIDNGNNLNYSAFLEMARQRFKKLEVEVKNMTFNGNVILELQKAFSNELKRDFIKLDKPRDDAHIRFYLKSKPYIFGYFRSDEESDKYSLQNQYTLKFIK